MLCGSLDGRGVWRKWIHLYVWLCPFPVHLKPLQHCLLISYTPTQYKKFKKKLLKRIQQKMNLVTVVLWYLWGSGSKIPTDTKSAHAQVPDIKKKKKRHSTVSPLSLQMWNLCVPTPWAEQLPVLTNKYILAWSLF